MLKIIKTEVEYDAAIERIYDLMQLELADNSLESNELKALALMVEDYESRHYPIAPPNPIEGSISAKQAGKPLPTGVLF